MGQRSVDNMEAHGSRLPGQAYIWIQVSSTGLSMSSTSVNLVTAGVVELSLGLRRRPSAGGGRLLHRVVGMSGKSISPEEILQLREHRACSSCGRCGGRRVRPAGYEPVLRPSRGYLRALFAWEVSFARVPFQVLLSLRYRRCRRWGSLYL